MWYERADGAVLTTLALRRGGCHDPGDPQPGVLALRAGLAVCRTLEGLGMTARVRWPNDILVGDRKICGILTEADARWFLIGVGLNLRLPTAADPARFATPPTALERHLPAPPGRAELGARLDGALETALTDIHWHGDLDARLAWRGELVRITGEAEERSGQLLGLDPSGALLLQGPGGTARVFSGSLRR